jgi:homoserine O-acetyltransferase/O-succinyltransferase
MTIIQNPKSKIRDLDDDPSVVAPTEAADLLSVKRYWDCPEPLGLECGATPYGVRVAYETWGTLNAGGDNAIYICHALTGGAHAAGRYQPSDKKGGWWNPMIGPGRAFDTDRYFVVCANILGGCQGTTGPAAFDPATGKPYGSRFPTITVRDMVRLEYRLLRALGVTHLACVTGGSLGGMQALEWLVCYPDFVATAIPIAASLAHSPQGIAFNLLGRQAIMLDPNWLGGDYYAAPALPDAGLALARMVGMISYQSDASMQRKFGRDRVDESEAAYYDPAARFQVENYLHYQGESLIQRFDANSYLILSRAMDLHDIGYQRGGIAAAIDRIAPATRTLVVGISSDLLFPTRLQHETVAALHAAGRQANYYELESPWGHDAFLIEYERLTPVISSFLSEEQE